MLNLVVALSTPLLIQISVYLLAALSLCLLGYYLGVFLRLIVYKSKRPPLMNVPVSVIIYAKNDAVSLEQTLPEILSQEYENFEVVVVDDHSCDNTAVVMEEFQKKYANLKFLDMSSSVTNIKGRKYPLSLAIKVSAYEHLLFTQADCMPTSKYWLQRMVSRFSSKKQIVLGHTTYPQGRGLFNFLLHFDAFQVAMQYFSYAVARIPFMGLGQNLAYTKTLFLKNQGFSSHYHLRYGEDDLFINEVATKNNCAVEYSAEAQTVSTAIVTPGSWLWDKQHHYTTRRNYKGVHRFLLDFYGMLNPLFYLSLAFAIWMSWYNLLWLLIAIGIFVVKTTVMYIIFGLAAKKINEKGIIPYILFGDFLFSFLNPTLYIGSKFTKNK